MQLDPKWRILTVGDGDLSFSYSIKKYLNPKLIVASIYDSEAVLREKYEYHALDKLRDINTQVITEFDATDPASWSQLGEQKFDVVIFQFPLIPAFSSHDAFKQSNLSINTLNRRLLRHFLNYSQAMVLDTAGPMLSVITSKDVKPYCEWNLEETLHQGLNIDYLGQTQFDITRFPEYKIRNVDRDKHVKDTRGISYFWSPKHNESLALTKPNYLMPSHCAMCRVGPFLTEQDKKAHFNSKKHKQMSKHENAWQAYVTQIQRDENLKKDT
ncbi:class I SAM-dependent methyltransferase [Pseudoalteromonas luteoviolacea]|uniref:25S rRNA (uridine-N(3))-methyltransferase BMT5-like domain-containing protein n=1 Tax=Pseudoalteromonas luteoviolacea S4054 TaxID=1129367 RepID=A0A0F6AEH9_9GAMM|nr:class I SAM-dependent methyltransferase [Pseudoalteromonas luteoviolacea]AOT10354.1 hypothetical protein S4054249_20975 [Pseudoalteromonas luteoviolacea]AOT15577.1 hypothetical protein S40542_22615 [Pseudoalteromonas luteoviolacea]AOT20172.1 hypothetical protein S4054_20890 [Pseudoalteromonas luteoviolacea]KKE84617.1 hypothetical protein N479_08610 [Pseudoalteromonas luteoviolacea S4054]KZN71238.1 hypothetical protein N481_18810 [Pseudoalteromonas luteoviolacea S4047-1]